MLSAMEFEYERAAKLDPAHFVSRNEYFNTLLEEYAVATKVVMPKLGTGMNEGTILRWLKAEGDSVNEGEPIVEIETTKTVEEMEAPGSGVLLKILLGEGETAEVRTLIAIIGEEGEDLRPLLG
mgnify:CR=1 FL=1